MTLSQALASRRSTAYGMPAFKAGKNSSRFATSTMLTEHFANYPAVLARLANMHGATSSASCSARHGATRWSGKAPPKKKRRVAARGRR